MQSKYMIKFRQNIITRKIYKLIISINPSLELNYRIQEKF